MRVTFLPILLATLSVLSPILAQDPTGADDSGNSDNSGDTGASDSASATDDGTTTDTASAPQGTDGGNSGTTGGIAGVVPSEPTPDTVYKVGDSISVTWSANSAENAQTWDNMTVSLMTGSNLEMVKLIDVGTEIDGTTTYNFTFSAPDVTPYSNIYFIQLTSPPNTATEWTGSGRFTIQNGPVVDPANTDSNGVKWGIGKLAGNQTTTAGPGTGAGNGNIPIPTKAPPQSGVGANGITIYTKGINTGLQVPDGITLTGVAAATLGAKGPQGGSGASPRAATTPAAIVGAIVAAAAFFA